MSISSHGHSIIPHLVGYYSARAQVLIDPIGKLNAGIRLAIDICLCQTLEKSARQHQSNQGRGTNLSPTSPDYTAICKVERGQIDQHASSHQYQERIEWKHITHIFGVEAPVNSAINNHPGE